MESLHNRICRLREAKSLSQAELAKAIGVHSTSIQKWEAGTALPRAQSIRKMAQIFEVSSEYLQAGAARRDQFIDPDEDDSTEIGCDTEKKIRIYGFVSCGKLNLNNEELYGTVDAGDVRNPRGCFAIIARGTSMTPEIHDGDLLIFRRVDGLVLPPKTDKFVPPNRLRDYRDKIVIVTVDDETTVKRLKLSENSHHWHLHLQPDNREYDTILLESTQTFTLNGVLVQLRRNY